MSSQLKNMVKQGVVKAGDELWFEFKGHRFAARLTEQGALDNCTWRKPGTCNEEDTIPVFQNRAAFDSLTCWSDSVIQELLNEFVTRFSAWKRVRHSNSNQTVGRLRDRLRLRSHGQTLCAACERRNILIEDLERKIARIEKELQDERALKKPRVSSVL